MDKFRSDSYDQHINELIQKFHVPGLSIAVFDNGDLAAKAFGHASLQPDTPAKPDSLYDMASTSKSITAASIGKLIAQKHTIPDSTTPISWTTPVSKLLPSDFVLSNARSTAETTLEDILSHRSGMPSHDDCYLGIHHATPDTPQTITRNLRNLPVNAARLEKFQYCNMMYTVATHVLESLTKTTFGSFIQANIFEPLGMKSTYLQPSAVAAAGQTERIARPYVWRKETQSYDELSLVESPEAQGAGSLQSTVLDFAKWVQAMIKKDEALFDTEIYDELVKPRIIVEPASNEGDPGLPPFQSPDTYGLGWETMWYRGYRIVSHDGGISGYGSKMMFVPKLGFGLVLCGNSDGLWRVGQIISLELLDELFKVNPADRVDLVKFAQNREEQQAEKLDNRKELREEIGEGRKEQEMPLDAYTGTYYHAGYHDVTVEVKSGSLHINGSKRSNPITFDFEHIRDDEFFIATFINDEQEVIAYLKAVFEIDEQKKVTAVGIDFEEELKELIWFRRID